jgi:Holliday junction resolvase-like predicted endonuclease
MDYLLYERHAAAYIQNKGYEILHENYRRSRIQIDVVARKEEVLVIIEVKYRKNGGVPCELISHGQLQRIQRETGPLMVEYRCFEWQLLLFFYSGESLKPQIFPIEC